MSKQPRGLGSGLGALLPVEAPRSGVREVPIASIRRNPRQPRTALDEAALDELAASIREHGIIQPLIVSEREVGQYELVAGERRWRAAQRAGIDRVPVIIRETTPQELLELALIENVQRADLNPIEEAQAYEALKREFGLSDNDIARRIGKSSREAIVNTRRLLNLPPQAQEAILANTISAGHGRALLKVETFVRQRFGSQDQQQAMLESLIAPLLAAIAKHELSVRETERLGDLLREFDGDVERAIMTIRNERALRSGTDQRSPEPQRKRTAHPKLAPAPEDQEVQRAMERLLGTPVSVVRTDKELRITIAFHTDEKLQEFFDLLNAAQAR